MLEPRFAGSSSWISQGPKPRQQSREAGYPKNAILGANSRDNIWYTFYQSQDNTKNKCWKLHGTLNTSGKEWGYEYNPQKITKQIRMPNQRKEEAPIDLTIFSAEIEWLEVD